MDVRKHFLDQHRVGDDVLVAAEAYNYAARTPGARVELVGKAAVIVVGDALPEQIEAFVADGLLLDAELARKAA